MGTLRLESKYRDSHKLPLYNRELSSIYQEFCNDRYHRLSVPAKDHYLYPLTRDFRRRLCDDT